MYFADAYPELSPEQQRNFQASERRLLRRLIIIGCFGMAILGVTLY